MMAGWNFQFEIRGYARGRELGWVGVVLINYYAFNQWHCFSHVDLGLDAQINTEEATLPKSTMVAFLYLGVVLLALFYARSWF
jgi:hypothetical protein